MKEHVLQQKEAVVQEILENIQKAQSMVIVEYRGLSVEAVTDLRNKYREADVFYKVYKNTMVKRAFEAAGIESEELDALLKGPNAIAFSMSDAVAGAKTSVEFAKTNDKLVIKAGVVDGVVINKEEVERLAKLPSREVLVAQVLGTLNAPIAGLANVLQGTIRKVVYALDAIREKQEQAA